MAFASFGIISPVLSVVVSMFMLGLSLGAWGGGRSIGWLVRRTRFSAIAFYALAELMIGLGAFAVPKLFSLSEHLLLATGQTDSVGYLLFSALFLALSILPWCVFMGTTFPFMMAFVREHEGGEAESFSYLYLANVLGAMSGTLLAAIVFVELFGFKHTLWLAAAGNFSAAAVSACLSWSRSKFAVSVLPETNPAKRSRTTPKGAALNPLVEWILFSTGFCTIAMEVVWVRAFTPVMKTQVYSFALIVFAYLGATLAGSSWYRRDLKRSAVKSIPQLSAMLALALFLPIVLNDVRFLWDTDDLAGYLSAAVLLISICPFCALLGYLTPSLIDKESRGDPASAGKAYAINMLGCILGPLFASYILMPWVGEKAALLILGFPFLAFFLFAAGSLAWWYRSLVGFAAAALLLWSLFGSVDFANFLSSRLSKVETRRDYAASVVSAGEGFNKHLFVNGVGMTALSPVTKFMVHLPLVFHQGKAESALIICFGMGTTYRSALSWNIETTAVELVPSVKEAFAFYHADAARVLSNPRGHIVIDDGRRFLKRTREKFDVIVIDPPPPVEAAGSSLLYSEEFYELAKQRLKPNGILQAWFPGGESATKEAIVRSLTKSFPYVRCFRSVVGSGVHMLASMEPFGGWTPREIANFMPSDAARDLLEWSPSKNVSDYFEDIRSNEDFSPDEKHNSNPEIRVTDDRPFNEYFLLRHWGLVKTGKP
jgi:spermidine synthase